LLRQLVQACGAGLDANLVGGASPAIHQGLIVSGDRFVSGAGEVTALRSALQGHGHNPLAVEMEGAAVAQTCADYGIPFAAVRTISDRADDTAHVDFQQFVESVASVYARNIIGEWLRAN
jgi:adenosylhomocysteine nucleosidase